MKLIKTLAPALIATLALTGVASNASASTSNSVSVKSWGLLDGLEDVPEGYKDIEDGDKYPELEEVAPAEIRVGFFNLTLSQAKGYAKSNYAKTKTEYLKSKNFTLGSYDLRVVNGLLYSGSDTPFTTSGYNLGNSMINIKNGELTCADGTRTFKLYVTNDFEGEKANYDMVINVFDGKILSVGASAKKLPIFNTDSVNTSVEEAYYGYTQSIKSKINKYAVSNKKSNGTNYVKNVSFTLGNKVSDFEKFKAYKGYIYQYNGKGKYVKFTGKFNSTGKQISVKNGIVYADKTKPYTGQVQFKQKVKKYKATNLYLNGGKVVKVTQSSGTTNLR